MKIIADLHLHSHFSRATSKNLNFEHLSKWAQLKGVNVVGSGDIAHPGWLQEMKEKLEPAEDGLFKLKKEIAKSIEPEVYKSCRAPVRFMLAGEISNIYKRHDKVRKIHNVVFLPSFEAVEKFQAKLDKIGNIRSDGRPILGLDSRDLLEIVLETDPQGHLIPAHIWTPWFALLGSMSGFDSVEECFGDLAENIFALETGLSSDPPMNWRLSILDKYTLVSNSDAHSPQKLAREANVFDTELSYSAIFDALQNGDPDNFKGTIEFFPEEGKYHYDGHRKCNLRWEPSETIINDGVCTECGKKVTVGVMHRVEKLADRKPDETPAGRHPFISLVPLPEVLAEIHNVGANSKKVQAGFKFLLNKIGAELHILQHAPLEEIEQCGGAMVAEGIKRMRAGKLHIDAGYDGEFGIVRLFEDNERENFSTQLGLFVERVKQEIEKNKLNQSLKVVDTASHANHSKLAEKIDHKSVEFSADTRNISALKEPTSGEQTSQGLNTIQRQAVEHFTSPLIIFAGPGTGKTHTLTHKIAYLVEKYSKPAENILAVTFTNRAAKEMTERLAALLSGEQLEGLTVCTFHALATNILREDGNKIGLPESFSICADDEKKHLLKEAVADIAGREITDYLDLIAFAKNHLVKHNETLAIEKLGTLPNLPYVYKKYQEILQQARLLDFEDLILLASDLLESDSATYNKYRQRFQWIFIDEYQDINKAQYKLMRLLVTGNPNLFVIGDPDQSIYGFRGANRAYFLRFCEDFPEARVINLTQNYRSTQTILNASKQLLATGATQPQTNLLSSAVGKAKLTIHRAATEKAEAEFVVHEIEKAIGGTSYFSIDSGRVKDENITPSVSFADFAVLCRTKMLFKPLKQAFIRSGIPFQIVGEKSFLQSEPVNLIMDYLSFIDNCDNSLRLINILPNSVTGIGKTTISKLTNYANNRSITIWEAVQTIENNHLLNTKQKTAIKSFIGSLAKLQQLAMSQSVSKLIDKICSSFLKINESAASANNELLDRLILLSKPYKNDLKCFLDETTLQHTNDEYNTLADRVTLMTLHASKGLEFSTVFIIGCEEKLVPLEHSRKKVDIEEERRLLYVGMTRARNKLYLSTAKARHIWGRTENPLPSRFLKLIEDKLKETTQTTFIKKQAEKNIDLQIELF